MDRGARPGREPDIIVGQRLVAIERRQAGIGLEQADRGDAQLRRDGAEIDGHAAVGPRMAVAGDQHHLPAAAGAGAQCGRGEAGVAQALDLDHAGRGLAGQLVAMGGDHLVLDRRLDRRVERRRERGREAPVGHGGGGARAGGVAKRLARQRAAGVDLRAPSLEDRPVDLPVGPAEPLPADRRADLGRGCRPGREARGCRPRWRAGSSRRRAPRVAAGRPARLAPGGGRRCRAPRRE